MRNAESESDAYEKGLDIDVLEETVLTKGLKTLQKRSSPLSVGVPLFTKK